MSKLNILFVFFFLLFFLGYYRIYTNKDEVELLIKYCLNYLKQQATLPIVSDYLKFAQDSRYLIARERCEFIFRLIKIMLQQQETILK
jgi:hypothetical protein